jgi:pyrroline-5-carboxylate reductase
MKTQSLGFIGGGRITRIILQAFKNKNATCESIRVFDTNNETADQLKEQFPDINLASTAGEAAQSDVVFIALHPPVIMETLDTIKDHINPDTIILSLAPKISIGKIRSVIHTENIARLIPSATSFINEGYNPVCFAGNFDEIKKQPVLKMLSLLGLTFEVDEAKLEGYAITSAMLPTYFWFQWNEMIKVGMQTGLDRIESEQSVHQSLLAALNLMFNKGLSYEEITDLIPVKPIGENEAEIKQIFQDKLMGLYQKIKA